MANIFYPEKTPAASFVQPAKPSQQECINYFVSFLRQFDVFANSDFEEVIPMLKYTHWKKNQPVFEVGKVHTYMNFVVSGAFEFYAEDQHGRSIIGFLTACNFCSPSIISFPASLQRKVCCVWKRGMDYGFLWIILSC